MRDVTSDDDWVVVSDDLLDHYELVIAPLHRTSFFTSLYSSVLPRLEDIQYEKIMQESMLLALPLSQCPSRFSPIAAMFYYSTGKAVQSVSELYSDDHSLIQHFLFFGVLDMLMNNEAVCEHARKVCDSVLLYPTIQGFRHIGLNPPSAEHLPSYVVRLSLFDHVMSPVGLGVESDTGKWLINTFL